MSPPPVRRRNPAVTRTFNLRDLTVPSYAAQQAHVQRQYSRVRIRAAKKAWATRVARYGPMGRRHHNALLLQGPVTIGIADLDQADDASFVTNTNPSLPSAAISGKRRLQAVRAEGPPTSPEIASPAAALPNPHHALNDEGERASSRASDSSPRPSIGETAVAEPPRSSISPASPPPPRAQDDAHVAEMTRLLDERRALLLGPQDLSAPVHSGGGLVDRVSSAPRVAESAQFTIFADGEDEGGEDEDDEDKENARPSWYGRQAPRAPGALEFRDVDRATRDMQSMDGEREVLANAGSH